MEVIVDVRDGDMSKNKKYCRRTIRQQRRKKQLTWKGWWRRKILNQWYHCKARCNCLKACFNSPLSACFSQLPQPLLSAASAIPLHREEQILQAAMKLNRAFRMETWISLPVTAAMCLWLLCSPGLQHNCVNTGQSQNICL